MRSADTGAKMAPLKGESAEAISMHLATEADERYEGAKRSHHAGQMARSPSVTAEASWGEGSVSRRSAEGGADPTAHITAIVPVKSLAGVELGAPLSSATAAWLFRP